MVGDDVAGAPTVKCEGVNSDASHDPTNGTSARDAVNVSPGTLEAMKRAEVNRTEPNSMNANMAARVVGKKLKLDAKALLRMGSLVGTDIAETFFSKDRSTSTISD